MSEQEKPTPPIVQPTGDAVYANLFSLEIHEDGMVQIIFVNATGLFGQRTAAHAVMTLTNFQEFCRIGFNTIDQHKANQQARQERNIQ